MLLERTACCFLLTFLALGSASRLVVLHRGNVETTTQPVARRSLGAVIQPGVSVHTQWLVGLPSTSQEEVVEWLGLRDGRVLHPVPDDHLLVRATDEVIYALLTQFPGTTAASLDPIHKQSLALDPLISAAAAYTAVSEQAARVQHTRTQVAGSSDSGGRQGVGLDAFKSMLPKELGDVAASQTGDGVVEVTLNILGEHPLGATHAERKQAARTWADDLQDGLLMELSRVAATTGGAAACEPTVTAVGVHGGATAQVCTQQVEAAIVWLSEQPSVTFVDVARPMVQSDIVATSAIQTGALPDPMTDLRSVEGATPLWDAGIDGTGQILAVTDTGVDMDSCYFHDPKFPHILANTSNMYVDAETKATYFYNPSHRKVVMYVLGDSAASDDTMSHGTHCAGVAVGACFNASGPDYGTGVAPGAKLAMYDVSNPTQPEYLNIPVDIGLVIEPLYQKGARVISNSWGSTNIFNYYMPDCNMMDFYVWARPDTVVLFAAGNNGTNTARIYTTGTVSPPATCKNVIAVGATDSMWNNEPKVLDLLTSSGKQVNLPPASFSAAGGSGFSLQLTITQRSLLGQDTTTVMALSAGAQVAAWEGPTTPWSALPDDTPLQVVLASPTQACWGLQGNYSGKVVLIRRGNCTFAEKGLQAMEAGAAAVLVYNDQTGVLDGMILPTALELASSSIPFGFITNANAQPLVNALSVEGGGLTLRVVSSVVIDNVAYFSSYGPSPNAREDRRQQQDLRVKPDLMAPGYTRSAKSDGKLTGVMDRCRTETMSGTSMATPGAAGAAALVRQYFMDGFYPTGARNTSDGFEPSASLVKAVLVGGAAAMKGITISNGVPLAPPPNGFQGFGRVDLSRSLPLKEAKAGGWHMKAWDREVVHNQLTNRTYTFTASGNGPVIVTLVWMDWPGWPGYVQPRVNDLDLTVDGPSKSTTLSQLNTEAQATATNTNSTYWGNGVPGGDGINNVERVYIEDAAAGEYTITVSPYYLYIAARPQPYAIVVLGALQGEEDRTPNPESSDSDSGSSSGSSSDSDSGSPPHGDLEVSKPPSPPPQPTNTTLLATTGRASATKPRDYQSRRLLARW